MRECHTTHLIRSRVVRCFIVATFKHSLGPGAPREAGWVRGSPSTISTPLGRSGAVPRVSLPVAPLIAWGYPANNPPEQDLTL